MDPVGRIRKLAERHLGRQLGRGDAVSERRIATAERRLGLRLPDALRAYYRLAGRAAALNEAHNQLLSPEALEVQERRLIFMDENQSVVSWGFPLKKLDEADPTVWQRTNTPPIEWFSEEKRFTAFMASMFHWYRTTGAHA